MSTLKFRKILFLCCALSCSGAFAADYTRTGTGNWADAVWTVNGTPNQAWADGNQAGITIAAGNTLNLGAAATVTGISFTGLGTAESAAFSGGNTLTFTGDAQTFNVASGTLTFQNLLSGTGIVKTGAGTLEIKQIQNAFGGLTVQEGTLKLSAGNFTTQGIRATPVTVLSGAAMQVTTSFVIGSGMVTLDGGTLHLTGDNYINSMTLKNGALVTAANGSAGADDHNSYRVAYGYAGVQEAKLTVTGTSASAMQAGITMVSGGNGFYTMDVASTGDASGVDLTISGKIFDFRTLEGLKLKKTGAGVLKLSSNESSWNGGTSLTAGTLILAANNAAGKGAITTSDGTSLILAEGISASVRNLSGNAALSAQGAGAGILVGVGETDASVSTTFGGTIGPNVLFTKTGAGTLTLTSESAESFTGLVVENGTLALSFSGNYGSAALKATPVTVKASGKLVLEKSFSIYASPVTLDGGLMHITGEQNYLNNLTLKNGARITAETTASGHADDDSFRVGNNYGTGANPVLTVSGTSASFIDAGINLTAYGSSLFTVTVNSTGDASGVDLTISGKLRDYDNNTDTAIPVKKMGAGVLRLTNNANCWTKGLEAADGTVQVSASQALGYGMLNLSGASSRLELLSAANGGAGTYNLKQLSGVGTVSVLGDAATLKVGSVTNASSQVLSGDSTFSGTFASNVTLVKTGAGKLTLDKSAGTGTIAGVSVTEGTLRLNGGGLGPTSNRYGFFGTTTIEVSGTGRLEAGNWNIQGTPIHVTGENAELNFAGGNYANFITLTDGADISGSEYRVGWWTDDAPKLTVNGNGTGSVLGSDIFMLLKNGNVTELNLTVTDTGAKNSGNPDLKITSQIKDHAGYEGMKIVKSGAGTVAITNTQNSWQGGIKIVDGRVVLSAGAGGTGAISVEAGGALSPAPTAAETYVSLANTTFKNGSELALIINSPMEFSRFTLGSVPEYDAETGFIQLLIADDANLGSDPLKVSNTYPGGSVENLDLESWLGTDFRYEWNLVWNAGASALLLSRDANAVPEPAAWCLLVLGVMGVFSLRRVRKM